MSSNGQQEPDLVITELDDLLTSDAMVSLSTRDIGDLRGLRDRLSEIEAGLSFGRRMAQGRLDIVLAEQFSRADGSADTAHDLLAQLPELLSSQARGGGNPRPVRDIEFPSFADGLLAGLDELLPPADLAVIETIADDLLVAAGERIAAFERSISMKRHQVHRLIDEVQEEIISRYRSGSASVDDLLRG